MMGQLLAYSQINTDEGTTSPTDAFLPTHDTVLFNNPTAGFVLVEFIAEGYGIQAANSLGCNVYVDNVKVASSLYIGMGASQPSVVQANCQISVTAGSHSADVRFSTAAGETIRFSDRLLKVWLAH
jgi:hypothetical protein